MAGDIFCAQVKEASTSLNKDEEIRMRHHLYSTEQLWDLGWNTHRNTQTRHIKWTICHTHSLVKTRHFSHTNTKILQKHKLILEHTQSYLHSSVESTQSFEKLSCSIGVLLSYPLLFVPSCDSAPSYVRHVFAFPHMWAPVWWRPEPKTQMAPRWRQITEQTSEHCTTRTLTYFYFAHVKLSLSLLLSLLPTPPRLLYLILSLLLTEFPSSLTLALSSSVSHPLNLSFPALAPPLFSHTLSHPLFSWVECSSNVTTPTPRTPLPFPCGSWPIIHCWLAPFNLHSVQWTLQLT